MMTIYTAANSLPMSALPTTNGIIQRFFADVTNSGSATFSPDGLAASPILGLGGQQLQGNEIVAQGVVTLISYIGPLLNSNSLCWILLDSAGGAFQVAPAQQSEQAVQFGQLTGLVGAMSNAKMSVAAASTSATFTADQIVVATALDGLQTLLPSFGKTINLASAGIGGVVGPALVASGYVGLYAAWGPEVGAGIFAINGDSLLPNIFSGTLPEGFTSSALISVWRLDASARFAPGHQRGRKFIFPPVVAFSTTTATAIPTSVPLATSVPPNAGEIAGILVSEGSGTGDALQLSVSADENTSGAKESAGVAATGAINVQSFSLILATAQTLFYSATVSGGVLNINIRISEYTIS